MRSIVDTLRAIGRGSLLDRASDELAGLVKAVDAEGGTGTITLTVTVKKASRGGAMLITGKCATKRPSEVPAEAMLFATSEGDLIADDPRQEKLDLKQVDVSPPATLKTA